MSSSHMLQSDFKIFLRLSVKPTLLFQSISPLMDWLTLQSCTTGHIISFLPFCDPVQTSILATWWQEVWTRITTLDFDIREALRLYCGLNGVGSVVFEDQEKPRFISWVRNIIDQHTCSTVRRLQINIPLNAVHQQSIDSWIKFVMIKKICAVKFFPQMESDKSWRHFFYLPPVYGLKFSLTKKKIVTNVFANLQVITMKRRFANVFVNLQIIRLQNVQVKDEDLSLLVQDSRDISEVYLTNTTCRWGLSSFLKAASSLVRTD